MKANVTCKRFLSLLLAAIMLLGALPCLAAAEAANGTSNQAETAATANTDGDGQTGSHSVITLDPIRVTDNCEFSDDWMLNINLACPLCGDPCANNTFPMDSAELISYTVSPEGAVTDFEMTPGERLDSDDGYVRYIIHGTAAEPGEATVTARIVCDWGTAVGFIYPCKTCKGSFLVRAEDMPQTATLIFPILVEKEYQLRYMSNGGETPVVQIQTQRVVGDSCTFTVSGDEPVRDGYRFLGWADSADAAEAVYHAGDSVTVGKDSEVRWIYAVWEKTATDYSLTYDANGGEGAIPAPQTLTSTENRVAFTVPAGEPTRAGYTFHGWGITPDQSSTGYHAGDPVDVFAVNPNVTLYAVWWKILNDYSVTYDANGDGVTGLPETEWVRGRQEDSYVIGLTGTPSRDGYKFKGWGASADSADLITEVTMTAEAPDVTVYAQWEANTYTLTLDAGDGKTEKVAVTYGQPIGELPTPTKDGCAFEGWYDADGSRIVSGHIYTALGDTTLTAKWTAKTTNPSTGDGTPVRLYAALMLFSVIALAAAVCSRKRYFG